MVCPNCRSSEVVAIQGENFCINCGQLMPKLAVSELETDGLPAGVEILPLDARPVKKLKRTKLGRPKAGPLDRPAAITHTLLSPPPEQTEPALVEPTSPKSVFQDIAPPTPRAKLPAVFDTVKLAYGPVLRSSIVNRFTRGRGLLAVIPVTLLGIIGGVVGLVLARGHANELIPTARQAGWSIGGELILVGILYYFIRSLTHAAIIFGTARLADHRPLPTNRWFIVAADSQGRRLGLDLIGGASLLAATGLIAALVVNGGISLNIPEWVQVAGLMIGFASLCYILVALIITISLAHIAVTLARVHAWHGLSLGWNLFRHHFELVGARLMALLLEFLLFAAVCLGATGWLVITPTAQRPLVVLGLAVILTTLAGLAGAGTAIWWTGAFRLLVSVDHPYGFNRLLSTQMPKPSRKTPEVVMSALLISLAVGAAIWPWFVR